MNFVQFIEPLFFIAIVFFILMVLIFIYYVFKITRKNKVTKSPPNKVLDPNIEKEIERAGIELLNDKK
jgi:hypothetical protein